MNGLNSSSDEVVECPLCMEPLEVDDLNFYPCTCGYQICRFCWHRIRTDENELCPACRKEYPENPADFTPLTQEEMIAFKSQKRQRDQHRKQKITENRKHLSNVRVVQRNLVFVVGLPPRLADADVLKKPEYFGKYGKIHKVVINPSTTYAGSQGPSASAYVTYVQNCDALRAIQSVNNVMIDGRLVKTSLGTTKYCSHFMKNQQCPKGDCMYLHELGDPEASFTKEEMHQGKHQEYEKRLHDALIATAGASSATGMGTASIGNVGNGGGSVTTCASTPASATGAAATATATPSKNGEGSKLSNGNAPSSSSSSSVASMASSSMSTSSTSSTSSLTNSMGTAVATVAAGTSGTQPKDAWPCLSVSPVNNGKESALSGGGRSSSQRHIKGRREKRQEKSGRNKNKNSTSSSSSSNNNSSSNNSNSTTNKENHHPHSYTNGAKEPRTTTATTAGATTTAAPDVTVTESNYSRAKSEKTKNSASSNRNSKNHQQQKQKEQKRRAISADEEVKLIQAADKVRDRRNSNRYVAEENAAHCSDNVGRGISDEQRSLSTSSSNSSSDSSSRNASTLSESTSGKSSPSNFPEHSNNNNDATDGDVTASKSAAEETVFEFEGQRQEQKENSKTREDWSCNADSGGDMHHPSQQRIVPSHPASPSVGDSSTMPDLTVTRETNLGSSDTTENDSLASVAAQDVSTVIGSTSPSSSSSITDTTAALHKLNIFNDNNSFFSSAASFQQSMLHKSRTEAETRPNQLNSVTTSHLPDLLNGVDGSQNNAANSNEWEEALNNITLRNINRSDEELQHHSPLYHQQQMQQQQQQHLQQHEEFLRIEELQKHNRLMNNIGLSQMNGPHNDFPNNFNSATDLSRLSQTALIQQQQQLLQQHQERLQQSYSADHLLGNRLFGTNMSKFFDFHKNQQQLNQQHFLVNGHSAGGSSGLGSPLSDHLRMSSMLENSRQFLDKPLNGVLTTHQQQQLQRQRLLGGKFDAVLAPQQLQSQNAQQQQQQQSRLSNQFSQGSSVDDDLGFDPFIETQKALAELMENEMVEQQKPTSTGSNSGSNATPIATNNHTKILQQQQHQQVSQQSQQHHQQQHHRIDSMQRARMPPPGFNHMNAFGFGVPRAQNSSKILPFMNVNGSSGSAGGAANGQPSQPQMQMPPNSWNPPHLAAAPMQQHTLGGDTQLHMNRQNQNGGGDHKGYSNSNDWTAMDPAILSFRQFSSFPQAQQQPPPSPMPPHHLPQDLFMQHVTQQQQSQQQQQQLPLNGFGAQSQLLHSGVNLRNPSTLLNPQNTAAQLNLSHSNWLSTEQSLFMNSLANGFTNNNFDKFSIPMPPGIHPNNLNKQQKTECIN